MITVGIDISSTKFDVAIFDGEKFKHYVFKQSYDGFNEFFDLIKGIDDEYMIAMESTGTYHVALKQFLNKKGIQVLVLHPYSLKNFMKSFSHSKTDKIDSKNIAKAVYILKDYVIKSSEPEDLVLELRNLLRARESIAKNLGSLKTQLKNDLKKYMPELLNHFSKMDSPVLLKLLSRYPTLNSIMKHRRKATNLLASFKNWNKEKALKVINDLKISIGIRHDSSAILIKSKIILIKDYKEQLELLEEEIQRIANELIGNFKDNDSNEKNNKHKNERDYDNHESNNNQNRKDKNITENEYYQAYRAIMSIPDSGELVTPYTIISEIGDISRFKTKRHLVSYIGFDPTISQSGKYRKNKRISKKGNSHLRRIFSLWAERIIKSIPQYKAKYESLIERGKPRKVALTAITRKLIELVYTLWKNKTTFNYEYLNLKTA
ncbi:hypothetical protein XO10_10375 [Marinitoga sp. 1135]|uniref:Transposase n=1 Tax=Marinitoga piezophila (strain DSM 14283 / JCM 11233 / KA3) TaxID=443254 RepID=H2J3V0_MARPK|nr:MULTISPECIES: IS110 family transposase [Marinitoga]AEX85842.1 transposase [Marinitoga piezophila KA3]NUU96642.1 hypothetical protein [Marinitoga sp. 1135]